MPGKVTQPVKPRYALFYLANLITLSQPNRSTVDRLYLPSKYGGRDGLQVEISDSGLVTSRKQLQNSFGTASRPK